MTNLTTRLERPQPADVEALERLHIRLESDAARDDLLDVTYRTIDTPLGTLLLASTERGLVRVAYEIENHDRVLDTLAAKVSPRILRSPRRLDDTARELDEYFAGARTSFDLPLDFTLSHGFRRSVLDHLPQIGFGHTESYAQVAQAAGSPRAVRAVGTACATNPLPLVVPCHRVVRSNGSYGQYAGGAEAKRMLLHMEASRLAA